jgi:hypothetical protein
MKIIIQWTYMKSSLEIEVAKIGLYFFSLSIVSKATVRLSVKVFGD